MALDILEWAGRTWTPEGAKLIDDTFELCGEVLGPEVETLITNMFVTPEKLDYEHSRAQTVQFCLEVTQKALDVFDVALSDEITFSDLPKINAIIETILSVDDYELPTEIIALESEELSPEDFLARLVHKFESVDEVELQNMIVDVSPRLIANIIKYAKEKIEKVENVDDEIPEQRFDLEGLQILMSMTECRDDIIDYVGQKGQLGYAFVQYLPIFADVLVQYDDYREAAIRWLMLWMFSGEDLSKFNEGAKGPLEVMYVDMDAIRAINANIKQVYLELQNARQG